MVTSCGAKHDHLIHRLTESDYLVCRERIKTYLIKKDLWTVLQTECPADGAKQETAWNTKNNQAKGANYHWFNSRQVLKVPEMPTAKTVWARMNSQLYLQKCLLSITIQEDANILQQLDKMLELLSN